VTTGLGVGVSPQSNVLEVEQLTWRVGGLTIVDGVSFQIRDGEFVSLIGPNGAGKSSLVNLLSGVTRSSVGTIRFRGEDITTCKPHARTRKGIGRTFQTSSLFPRLTVLENARLAAQAELGGSLSLVRRPRMTDRADELARHWLSEVGLAGVVKQEAGSLSHGDKRKLELAVVMCSEPRLLILDEPTAGVASEEVQPMVDVVKRAHRAAATVIMVEHRMDIVATVSDRIAVMHHGKLLMIDTPDAVLSDPTVRESYLGKL
jgi:branched-chain amino acid transport system ATP-binding protein